MKKMNDDIVEYLNNKGFVEISVPDRYLFKVYQLTYDYLEYIEGSTFITGVLQIVINDYQPSKGHKQIYILHRDAELSQVFSSETTLFRGMIENVEELKTILKCVAINTDLFENE